MPVDDWYSVRVRYRDMVRLNPDNFAVLFVSIIYCSISLAVSAMVHEPQVAQSRKPRPRYSDELPSLEIGEQKVYHRKEKNGIGCHQIGKEHDCIYEAMRRDQEGG